MVVVGVNSGDSIYYANKSITTNPNWAQIPGALTNVAYSNKQLYGVNRGGNIYYNPNYTSGNWVQVPGGLTQVSFDGYNMIVVGVNSGDSIYYANKTITTNPNWTQVPGALTNVAYSNKQLYGVNRGGNIYYNPDYTSGNWVQVPGVLKQVSFDGYNMIVVGVNGAGNIFYANKNITTNPNWTQIPGALTNVSYSNKQLYGVNRGGNIYYNPDYTSGNWVQVPGGLTQVSFEATSGVNLGAPPLPPSKPKGPGDGNPDLLFNTGGPSWGQYVIKHSLVPNNLTFGTTITIGSTPITIPVSSTSSTYDNNNTYGLGNIVLYNGLTYVNLAWNDPRGSAYSGSWQSSPDRDKNVWKQVNVEKPKPKGPGDGNPDLIFNTGGPDWGQYTVKHSLVPDRVTFGSTLTVGSSPISIPISKSSVNYNDNDTYFSGNIILYNGSNYINLAWNDPRGPAYSGSYRSSPDRDKNVWKKVLVGYPPVLVNFPILSQSLIAYPELEGRSRKEGFVGSYSQSRGSFEPSTTDMLTSSSTNTVYGGFNAAMYSTEQKQPSILKTTNIYNPTLVDNYLSLTGNSI